MNTPLAPVSVSTYNRGKIKQPSYLSIQGTQEILGDHWRKVISSGLLEQAQEAIEMLIVFALQVQNAQTTEDEDTGLNGIIEVLPYTARIFQKILSFYWQRGRLVKPHFNLADLIEAAVSQFLPTHCHQVSTTIWNFDFNSLNIDPKRIHLTQLESDYLTLVTPLLISSFLWNAFPDDEVQEGSLNPFEEMWI